MSNTPDVKKKKRRPLVALALVAVIGVTATFPFAFTTAIVRRVIGMTSLAELNPEIQSASLSLLGSLQLENVTLHDGERHPVMTADKVRIGFNWYDLLNRHVRDITATGLNITLRPDHSGNPTLLQLLPADNDAASPSNKPFRCDQFSAKGLVISEGFALPKQTPYSAALQMAGPDDAVTYDISLAVPDRLTLDVNIAPKEITLRRLAVPATDLTINPASLPPILIQHIPEQFRASPFTLKVADLQWAGTWHTDGRLAMGGDIKNLSAYFADENLPAVRDLSVKAEKFFAKNTPGSLTFGNLLIQCGAISMPQISVGTLLIEGTGYDGNLRIKQIATELAGGKINGNNIEFDIGTNTVKRLRLTISNVDQHELLKNIAPGKLDAEGRVNGVIDVTTNPDTRKLQGEVRLNSITEGRLVIGDVEALQDQIKKKLGNPGMAELVMTQLRNYPYRTGNLRLSSDGKTPELTLNYQRKPLQPGDAGYGQEVEVDGRKLKANQAVQINNLTISMPEQSIENILLLAAGAQNWLGHMHDKPAATEPSTTPATAPATLPAVEK